MSAVIYLEGGDANDASSLPECREAFRKLLEKAGFVGRMPKLVARGDRQSAYRGFRRAHKDQEADFVALLVDSEDPVVDPEKPWDHLANRPSDPMPRPENASDDQALLMTTCMETWIVADREALKELFGKAFRENALTSQNPLESRERHAVQDALVHATRDCAKDARYAKGRRSFKALQAVEPSRIRNNLPSFRRLERILHEKL